MRPPCELVQREFLPALRAKVARELKEIGLSQNEIADKMDLTQAAVSKYLSLPDDRVYLSLEASQVVPKLVKLVTSSTPSSDKIVLEICSACMKSRLGSTLCKLHKNNIPSLKIANCQICNQLLGGQDKTLTTRAEVLTDMHDAILLIESSDAFQLVMPQVRANLVMAEANATSINEVAGIPGRITLVNGKAHTLVSPQFGASQHTAKLLMFVKSQISNICSCLCISGRAEVVEEAKTCGFQVISMNESTNEADKIIDVLKKEQMLKKNLKHPAIHVPGGFGVEPILYLFGSNATDLSARCIQLCDQLES